MSHEPRSVMVGVWFDVEQDAEGEEYQEWQCGLCDDNGEPIGATIICESRDVALEAADKLAAKTRLPVEVFD